MIILYLFAVIPNIIAIYWLITESGFTTSEKIRWKVFWGAFVPVFSIIFCVAPERWRESIPLGIIAGTLIGYRWAYAEPRRVQNIKDRWKSKQ